MYAYATTSDLHMMSVRSFFKEKQKLLPRRTKGISASDISMRFSIRPKWPFAAAAA